VFSGQAGAGGFHETSRALPSALIIELSGWRPGYGTPPKPAAAVTAG